MRPVEYDLIRPIANGAPRFGESHLSDDFARVYEGVAHRITVPVSRAALDAVGTVGAGTRVLDIAAGAGALSLPAAERGAEVVAVDVAPGMVARLTSKLAGFPACRAQVGDGEMLCLPDGSFDATFSIFGVMMFSDWRKGLAEQARVTRAGGKGCVATWREPPGGGPFQILFAALRTAFPDRPAPPWPEGFRTLSDPDRLAGEMTAAGFVDVAVREVEAVWDGPVGDAYLEEVRELHRFIPPYAALDDGARAEVDDVIRRMTIEGAVDGRTRSTSRVVIAVGARA